MSHIFYCIWKTSCQNFNQIYCNCSEENGEEKEPIDIEFAEQKADSETMKMLLTLNDQK